MNTPNDFGLGKFIPGFEFLQRLAQNGVETVSGKAASALAAVPGLGQWIAPTVSVEDLDKRIQELKAVQFWLEQNTTALKATVQALEVQKMTLQALQGMNVSMGDLAKSFHFKVPGSGDAGEAKEAVPAGVSAPAMAAVPTPAPAAAPAAPIGRAKAKARVASSASKAKSAKKGASVADPMLWWGSLVDQFQHIAQGASRDLAKGLVTSAVTAKSKDVVEPVKAAAAKGASKLRAAVGRGAGTRAKRRPSRGS